MKIYNLLFLLITLLVCNSQVLSQSHRNKAENYFGVQVKPLIPISVVGDRPFDITEDGFTSTISPIFGYSYGGIVRVGITDLLAIETGLNYIRRNYRANYSVADSNVYAEDELGYVSFEVPVNFLVYIKLGQQMFMNVSIGASGNFNASNIRSQINPEGKHLFIFEGRRSRFFDFNANADVGFEYRTEKSGTFYLGLSGRVPFSPTLAIATEYRYGTNKTVGFGVVEGSTFSLNLRYFFHNQNRKKGVQFQNGPIEQ
ncbi:outer membrane beta-barrel protein [Brumimicrobium mesophilum]|uniref:outer membrane beta-barrel protein n=1 Tax=Brumimicrobium mesophilum TaxID=392717 RepID=UPI000D141E32|nr:outer membrane beta-barrel protein [Brumimicrobium mesophilum]